MVYTERKLSKFQTICRAKQTVQQKPWKPTVRKNKIAAENPVPKFVKLESLIGSKILEYSKKKSAPAYHFGRRYKQKLAAGGPSPANYTIAGLTNKGTAPKIAPTLKGLRECKEKIQTPGPEKYIIDSASKICSKTIPKYTFGYKRKLGKRQLVPAPNVFRIPSLLGGSFEGKIHSPPSYSMTSRGKPFFYLGFNTPSPIAYSPVYHASIRNPPNYSIRKRFHIPNAQKDIPGPGSYCPELYNAHRTAPAITFAIKHTEHLGVKKPHVLPTCIEFNGKPWKYF